MHVRCLNIFWIYKWKDVIEFLLILSTPLATRNIEFTKTGMVPSLMVELLRKTITIQWLNTLGWSSEDHTMQNSEILLGNYYEFCSLQDWYVEMSYQAVWMSLGLYQAHGSILFDFAVLAKCWWLLL